MKLLILISFLFLFSACDNKIYPRETVSSNKIYERIYCKGATPITTDYSYINNQGGITFKLNGKSRKTNGICKVMHVYEKVEQVTEVKCDDKIISDFIYIQKVDKKISKVITREGSKDIKNCNLIHRNETKLDEIESLPLMNKEERLKIKIQRDAESMPIIIG